MIKLMVFWFFISLASVCAALILFYIVMRLYWAYHARQVRSGAFNRNKWDE